MKILSIDSSSKSASVCLMDDYKIISECFLNTGFTHSQTIVPMIEFMLSNSGIKAQEIDLFAVATGPGSFTGVRIGISTIKGMALPYDKPCVSVSALEAMAYNFLQTDCIVCAVMDARCERVYNAIFDVSTGEIKRLTEDNTLLIDDLGSILSDYPKRMFLVGDGANLCYNKICERINDVFLAPEISMYQRASSIAIIGKKLFDRGNFVSSSDLVPIYLNPYNINNKKEEI